jgi:hypothetical protein
LDGQPTRLALPKVGTTAFASIARPPHSLISPLTNTICGAILHGYLHREPADPAACQVSRADSDRTFYWTMRSRGVRPATAGLIYIGARRGGGRTILSARFCEVGDRNAAAASLSCL